MAAHERYSKVGPYILMDTLGVGSFGKVKLAVHTSTYARYACKILDKSLVRERVLSIQVQKEIDIMQRLTHRNTVSLVSVLSSSSKVFIIMELVTGGELFDEILRHRRLSEPYARFYFRQLIEGLQHCHDHGVYHRDLKPENLLLDENKTLKITDFGLSTLRSGSPSTTESVTGSLTLHTQCGTPNYVAPEIITLDAEGYSGAKVDAWSCGIILYVLVAGALPFDASEMDVLFKLILRCDLTYPHFFSDSLVDLISNLLKTNPAERYSLADVRQHPWYSGPIESSMDSEETTQSPSPASTATQNSTTHSPRSVSTENAHDQLFRLPSTQTGHPSNLSHLPLTADQFPDVNDAPTMNPVSRRSLDSLDFGMHAESESDFSVPSVLGRSTHQLPPSPVLPAAISDRVMNSGVDGYNPTDSHDRDAPSPEDTRPGAPNGVDSNPLINRLRTRMLASEGSVFVPSSDEEQEFGEAKELRVPDGFFGLSTREINTTPMPQGEAAMRRAYSLSTLATLDTNDTQSPQVNNRNGISAANVEVTAQSGMRGRVKRQLWDRAAETWRIPEESYHLDNAPKFARGQDLAHGNALDNGCSGGLGVGESGRRGESGVRTSTQSSNSMRRSAIMKSTSVSGDLRLSIGKDCSTTGLVPPRLVRANSHDGTISAPPMLRRGRSKGVADSCDLPSAQQPGSHRTVMKESVERVATVGADVDRQLQISEDNCAKYQVRPQKRRPGKVRFRDMEEEPQSQPSEFRPDGDWVDSDVGKMLWCRMMKDYDMIYDDDEFEIDSSSLNELWTKALEKEGFNRKGSFAASRFGSPSFVPSRSTQYLSSHASLHNRKRWQSTRHVRKRAISKFAPKTARPVVPSKGFLMKEDLPPLQQIAHPISARPISPRLPQLHASIPLNYSDVSHGPRMVRPGGVQPQSTQVRNTVDVISEEAFAEGRETPISSVPRHMVAQGSRVSSRCASPSSGARTPISNHGDSPREILAGRSIQIAGTEVDSVQASCAVSRGWQSDGQEDVEAHMSEGSGRLTGRRHAEVKWNNSDRANGASPVESISSGAMRSGGSDGLMSTPGDAELSDITPSGNNVETGQRSGTRVYSPALVIRDGAVVEDVVSTHANAEDKSRPPMYTRSKSRRDDDEAVSPFSLEIPGPRGKSLPAPMPLHGLISVSNPAKPLLRKAMAPLHVKSYTEFHSLLEPLQCYNILCQLLREYGCSVVKGTVAKAGEKYRIRCETRVGTAVVAATVSVYKIDNRLTVVLFKRRGKANDQAFFDFYANMHSLYCERWKTMADSVSEMPSSSRQRRGRFLSRLHSERRQSEGRSGRGSSVRTESSDSGSRGVRNGDIECVTPNT